MAGQDRWGYERHRQAAGRERGERDYDRHGRDPDHFNRFDRESFGREGFGGDSRDYPGGSEYHSYGHDRGSMGRRDEPGRDWDSGYRSGDGDRDARREYGRDRGFPVPRDRWPESGREPGAGYGQRSRSVGEMAFGRDQSGRDDPGHFGRARESERDGGWFGRMGEEVASWFGGGEDEEHLRRLDLRDRGGAHRGRGPKSYQRSDERIREDVNDRLTDDPQLDASDIEVGVSGREVTLSGTVSNRYDKRRAEDLADSVSGVTHVQNNLRVRGSSGWSDERVSGTTEPTGIGSAGTAGRSDKSGI